MKKKKPGLGALGIDVLLSTGGPAPPAGDASLRTLPVELIHRSPYQPRRQVSPEALQELADSIRRQGILQPVVVRRVEGEYQLIAGERRWRAAQQAGLLEIPAVIRDADDQEAAALALVENLQREDLNPLEEARAYSGLVEQFGLTHQEVGEAVGRSRAAVSNSLRLLALPAGVQDLLDRGQIEMGHARALLALEAAGHSPRHRRSCGASCRCGPPRRWSGSSSPGKAGKGARPRIRTRISGAWNAGFRNGSERTWRSSIVETAAAGYRSAMPAWTNSTGSSGNWRRTRNPRTRSRLRPGRSGQAKHRGGPGWRETGGMKPVNRPAHTVEILLA